MVDCIIIGGGPAGMTAALYTGRSQLLTKVFEKNMLGGQILLTETIENFPGIFRMNASDWVDTFKRQLSELKDVTVSEQVRVERIEKQDEVFKIHLVDENSGEKSFLESRAVIVATGAHLKRLGIKGEEGLIGRGVSFCATCDAPFFKDKDIVVVGGGNAALEEALYLRKFARRITILHRRDELRAAGILQDKVKHDEKIVLKLGNIPQEILGSVKVEGIRIQNVKTSREEVLSCDGVFIFVGASPESRFLKDLVELNEFGYIVTDGNMATTCPGIFAVGDCRLRPLNQVVTACSDGAIAAAAVLKFLEEEG